MEKKCIVSLRGVFCVDVCWEDLSTRTATGTEGHKVYVEDQWKERDKTAGALNAYSLRTDITRGLLDVCTVAELRIDADWLIGLTTALPWTLAQLRYISST